VFEIEPLSSSLRLGNMAGGKAERRPQLSSFQGHFRGKVDPAETRTPDQSTFRKKL
jgi:hypothetical protein